MSVIDFNSLVNFGQNAFAETFEGLANAHRMDRFFATVGKKWTHSEQSIAECDDQL